MIEHWVVVTRPKDVNGFGLTTDEANRQIDDIERTFIYLPEPPDVGRLWLKTAKQYQVIGKSAHNTRLIALMLAHDIKYLLTLNPLHFSRYRKIIPITTQEVLHNYGSKS